MRAHKTQPIGYELLGSFNLPSGKVRVTDPCYDRDVHCSGELKVKSGKWFGAVNRTNEDSNWGVRISEIYAFHESACSDDAELADENSGIDVGVDSGQAGFFADELYPTTKDGFEYSNKECFYGRVCEITSGEKSAGIVPEGVVSSSGFGDGGYKCLITRNDYNEIVGMKIVFIGGDEPNDDGEEWDTLDESPTGSEEQDGE